MKIIILSFIIYLSVLPSELTYSYAFKESITQIEQESTLRFSESLDSIITDLKLFIPNYMNNANIPGVQIALIQDDKLAWTEGFGIMNTITGEPITTNTLFEIASLSKVVTAYMALKLVDEGKISFEKPLHNYLTEEWMPYSVYRDSIKLNHVLSHSSGLSKTSKDIMFQPGTAYYYSANGFNLLKDVMEEVTKESFEELAQRLVFKPLGMKNSSFVRQEQLIKQTAYGHIRGIVPFILFAIPFTTLFIIVLLIGLIIIRLRTKSWKLKRLHLIIFISVAFVLLVTAFFFILGSNSLIEFAWFLGINGLVMLSLFLIFIYTGQKFIINKLSKKKGIIRILSFVWGLIVILIILFTSMNINNIPVPRSCDYEASPTGTMRTSSQDLALFLMELSNPYCLKSETAKCLRTSQIKLSENLSWGMGPGILYCEQGYALWQWGQHIDFQSIMIIYPEHKFGVVVCTNNDLLNPDVALEIAHHAIGGMTETIQKAIHLEYDFRE